MLQIQIKATFCSSLNIFNILYKNVKEKNSESSCCSFILLLFFLPFKKFLALQGSVKNRSDKFKTHESLPNS